MAPWLVVGTMVYNAIESVIGLWSGVRADSVALVGFGLDSIIELLAAAALLWRLVAESRGAPPEAIEAREHAVHRFVGVTFFGLALYVATEAAWTLWRAERPEISPVGIALAAASLTIMPLVAWGKLRAADEIGSAALRAEARETLACSYLSFTLLFGLIGNAAAGWWWADPFAAMLMIPWLIREGREGWKGGHD